MLWKLTSALALALAMAGCSTMTASVATNDRVCTVWRPVSWSVKDTPATIGEVKSNNARRNGYCK